MSYEIMECICPHCGRIITQRAEQFAYVPECAACDSIMLVNKITTVEKGKLKCLLNLSRKFLQKLFSVT